MNPKRTILFGVLCLVMLAAVGVQPAPARTIWQDGVITRGPWTERHLHLEINGDLYTLMPEVRICRMETNSTGGVQEQPASLTALAQGRQVKIRVQGRRIYELLVF
ncbi:MAG: hypothetical protein AUK55_07860 [Syntrophobacteraceae bacterium CG2_30_61_12]|nr:MAG: hypothetical protein AUK55_07860 [Syntrophobacteraceae bacterium CG2_30_61_12]PIU32626.1 MAG: hypothetical protein COT06_01720 [Syntrophobacteraceae bacterium CG07_land_8_20_14_0_80_61_8]